MSATSVQERGDRNGLGVASFCTGAAGAVIAMIPILAVPGLAAGLVGLGLGLGGACRLRRHRASNKVMTVLGIVASVLAIILGIAGMVIVTRAVNQIQSGVPG